MKLYLFTNSFPFGKGETFLESEILILSNKFEEVIIYPNEGGGTARKLPENCHCSQIDFGPTRGLKSIIVRKIAVLVKIALLDFFSKENRKALKRPKAYLDDLLRLFFEAERLNEELPKEATDKRIFYTYWFSTWTTRLALIKRPKDVLVTRSHGYDFNIERNLNGYFPFRPFTWRKLDFNYNVSLFGTKYLKERYGKFKSKIGCAYLGVQDQSNSIKSNKRTIVSCSNVIELKRVSLIAQVLKETNRELHWVHFGDGVEMENVKRNCQELPKNITWEFKGAVPNTKVLEWYENNEIGAFVHLSSSEGLPVSMMEVQSFGIPILACDVGGVGEIVTPETGVLLDKEFKTQDAVEGLNTVLDFDEDARMHIQNEQKSKFSMHTNYTNFADNLMKKI